VPVDLVNRVLPRLDEGATEIAGRASADLALASAAPSPAGAGDEASEAAKIAAAEANAVDLQVEYRLPLPITIEDGQSALVPVIAATLPTDRVAIYQPDVASRHPLAAAQLTNDTEGDLPPGAVTVYERSDEAGAVTYSATRGSLRCPPARLGS